MRRLEDISAEDLVLTHTTIMSGLSKIFKFPGVIKKRRAVGHELPTFDLESCESCDSCDLRITCDIDACIDTSTCIH